MSNTSFDQKPHTVQVGAGDLIKQYQHDDGETPLNDNVQGVLNEKYPTMRLLGGIYYNFYRVSPCQIQVLLFDGFDYVRVTQEYDPREFRIGLTQCLKAASEALGDVDPQVYDAIWADLTGMNG